MIRPRAIAGPALMAMLLLSCSLGTGCADGQGFDKSLRELTSPYRFRLVHWELRALGEELGKVLGDHPGETDSSVSEVTGYFAAVGQIKRLESEIVAIGDGNNGELASLEAELSALRSRNTAAADNVERLLEGQIRETLSQQGIFSPIKGSKAGFPPVNFEMGRLPHLLVISPRDRIESLREVALLPEMGLEAMESLEDKVDKLGVSSLVVELGGMATYPTLVTDRGDLRFTLDAATEEWLHQYLAFKPLGFRYLLDLTGICRDYEIATMNETVAGMASKEIGAIIYEQYYAEDNEDNEPPATPAAFDFNREMREIRRAVDDYLDRGEVEPAEEFMERQRQYLADKGYHIRKLNQAYFAFHGAYADSPASVSPIGAELRELRSRSASLKDFLETAAAMTSRRELAESIR